MAIDGELGHFLSDPAGRNWRKFKKDSTLTLGRVSGVSGLERGREGVVGLAPDRMERQIMRSIRDAMDFLVNLGLIVLAKLLLVVFALAEAVAMVVVCYWSVSQMDATGHTRWLLLPVAAIFGVGAQRALWQYWWQRIAQRGPVGRALGEYFAISLRHPVVRAPDEWE